MSESCYCRLGGLFLLEVDSRWEKGWVSLLMGPMIKTTCVCVTLLTALGVHNSENVHSLGET